MSPPFSPLCKSQSEPGWQRQHQSPRLVPTQWAAPGQGCPGELQAPDRRRIAGAGNALQVSERRAGTERRRAAGAGSDPLPTGPARAKPIAPQEQLHPQGEFHKGELALGERYFRTENREVPGRICCTSLESVPEDKENETATRSFWGSVSCPRCGGVNRSRESQKCSKRWQRQAENQGPQDPTSNAQAHPAVPCASHSSWPGCGSSKAGGKRGHRWDTVPGCVTSAAAAAPPRYGRAARRKSPRSCG